MFKVRFWWRRLRGLADPPPPADAYTFAGWSTPNDLAVAFAAALMQSGQYATPGAAIAAAWAAVPDFYLSGVHYAQHIAPLHFAPVSSPAEGADDESPDVMFPPGFTEALNDRQAEGAAYG